ncbi:MAG: response regulator [Nanoarchaeota archaeon]|nr:response regulator [Nanoarchaeota archaeon]
MGKKILVVDDEPDVRTLISTILSAEKFDVVEAANGQDAIDTLKKDNVDLVLLDIMMPRMDGLHTAHEIRKFSKVPIVVVSVKDDDVTINMAKKLYGVVDYIKKPFHNTNLVISVKKALKMN